MKNKNQLLTILKLFLAILLLGYLAQSGYFSAQRLAQLIQLPMLIYGTCLVGLVLFFASLRFQTLSLAPLSIYQSWKLTLVGTFFNFFVPGGVGGDLVKGVMMRKGHETSSGSAAFSVLMDRILGLASMSLLSMVSFLFIPEQLKTSPRAQWLAVFLTILFITITIILMLLVSGRLRVLFLIPIAEKLPMFLQKTILNFHEKQQQKKYKAVLISWAFGYSLLSQLGSIMLFYLIGIYIYPDLSVSLATYFFVVPIGFMLTAIPISPGGIGVGQAAFLFLFHRALGYQNDLGVTSVTGLQFYSLFWGLVGAIYFVAAKRSRTR